MHFVDSFSENLILAIKKKQIEAITNLQNVIKGASEYNPKIFALVQDKPQVTIEKTIIK